MNTIKFIFVVSLIFFSFPLFSFAEVGDEYTIFSESGGLTSAQFGHNSIRVGFCDRVTFSQDTYVSTSSLKLYKYGSPADSLQGYIFIPTGNPAVATTTSTNTVLGSTLPTDLFSGTTEFYYDNFFVASGTTACIGVMRTGSYNASNYYKSGTGSGTLNTCYVYSSTRTCAEYLTGSIYHVLSGYEYTEGEEEEDPPEEEPSTGDTLSTSSIAWLIGSTTDVIDEQVTYLISVFSLLISLFIFLTFTFISYRFTKLFF